MIAVAFMGIAIGYLLTYCGITNRDPRKELIANAHGGHSEPGAVVAGFNAPDKTGTGKPVPDFSMNPSGKYRTGKLAMLPLRYGTHPGMLVDKGTVPVIKHICTTFNVKLSSGYRPGSTGDHRCGLGGDFVGKESDMRDLWNWANSQGFAYVEPWEDSMTVGRLGTTGPHVHISFDRCGAPLANKPQG